MFVAAAAAASFFGAGKVGGALSAPAYTSSQGYTSFGSATATTLRRPSFGRTGYHLIGSVCALDLVSDDDGKSLTSCCTPSLPMMHH